VGSTAVRSYSTGSAQAGYDYVQLLNESVRRYGAEIRFRTRAETLIYDEDPMRITGVLATNPDGSRILIQARAVILATGGFQADPQMRARFCPNIDPQMHTTANPSGRFSDGATGDGIVMAERLNAKLVDTQYVQILPFAGGRLLDYAGGEIWLNVLGERFVNEGTVSFSSLYSVIEKQPDQVMWAISDSKSKKGATLGTKLHQGIVKLADSVEEMAKGMDISSTVLKQTLDRYNKSVVNNYDSQFDLPFKAETIDTPPYYYGKETFSLHYCCGGIAIDTKARVLNTNDRVIFGLYAAGEVTGGVHGADRLGGHGLIDCFVFGRIAGAHAAMIAT
ncbi:MAG: FAD-binding protein, partial [Sutterellaceae bacterium]|nr:FAD-binding protein [Sutterellaceae bacterium]